jgi:hypothetical protein
MFLSSQDACRNGHDANEVTFLLLDETCALSAAISKWRRERIGRPLPGVGQRIAAGHRFGSLSPNISRRRGAGPERAGPIGWRNGGLAHFRVVRSIWIWRYRIERVRQLLRSAWRTRCPRPTQTMPQRRRRSHSVHNRPANSKKQASMPETHKAATWSPSASEAGVRRQSGQTSALGRPCAVG